MKKWVIIYPSTGEEIVQNFKKELKSVFPGIGELNSLVRRVIKENFGDSVFFTFEKFSQVFAFYIKGGRIFRNDLPRAAAGQHR